MNKLQWNLNRNSNIFIQENVFESVVCETAAILSRPQCVNKLKWQGCHWCRGIISFPTLYSTIPFNLYFLPVVTDNTYRNTQSWNGPLIWNDGDFFPRFCIIWKVSRLYYGPQWLGGSRPWWGIASPWSSVRNFPYQPLAAIKPRVKQRQLSNVSQRRQNHG